MHDIFEHLEFDHPNSWSALIEQKLIRHQFDPVRWFKPIEKMVKQVMEAELFPDFVLGIFQLVTVWKKWSFFSFEFQ